MMVNKPLLGIKDMKFVVTKPKVEALLFFIVSFSALFIAYTMQYSLNLLPCKLCIYERILYMTVIVISLLYFVMPRQLMIKILYLLIIINAIVSFYHLGLEYGWFSDIIGCTDKNMGAEVTFEKMKEDLLKKVVSCAKPGFMLWGLSMASWNFVYCVFCILMISSFSKRYVIAKKQS